MSLRFLRGYWTAFRILPITGKALLIAGYIVSGIICWSAGIATPSSNAQCLTGSCVVTAENVATTRLLGIVMIGGMTAMAIAALTVINVVLENHPEKVEKFLPRKFVGVSTNQFWDGLSEKLSPTITKTGLSIKMKTGLVLLWTLNVFIWTFLFPSVNPESLDFFLFAGFCVTFGSCLITIGVVGSKRLEVKKW